jgi:hypothetical protein
MRKSLLAVLVLALAVAISATAVTLAGDRRGDDRAPAAADKRDAAFSRIADRGARRDGHRRGFRHRHRHGMHARVLASLAERLDVTPEQLRTAVRNVMVRKRAEWAMQGKPMTPARLAALKDELATDLGAELDKPPTEILDAVRAELVAKLDKAVAIGFVTARGRELALGCFDRPAECDLGALRSEARLGKFRHHHR